LLSFVVAAQFRAELGPDRVNEIISSKSLRVLYLIERCQTNAGSVNLRERDGTILPAS
jgi:hypothetical protein